MIWWLIPLVATLAAWVYLRVAGPGRVAARRLPEPGSPEDRADLARFADALRSPLPGVDAHRPRAAGNPAARPSDPASAARPSGDRA